jgi:hypothetical protein
LKPVVFTFARLLEMVDMLVSCALNPVLLTHSAGCIFIAPDRQAVVDGGEILPLSRSPTCCFKF